VISAIEQTQTASITQMLRGEDNIRRLQCQLYRRLPEAGHGHTAQTFLTRHVA
jgi:hypothetical protein